MLLLTWKFHWPVNILYSVSIVWQSYCLHYINKHSQVLFLDHCKRPRALERKKCCSSPLFKGTLCLPGSDILVREENIQSQHCYCLGITFLFFWLFFVCLFLLLKNEWKSMIDKWIWPQRMLFFRECPQVWV